MMEKSDIVKEVQFPLSSLCGLIVQFLIFIFLCVMYMYNRIVLQCISGGSVATIKQVNLYFYHDPASGLGLPEFSLSASNYESEPGDPLSFVVFWNQKLSMDAESSGIRNVILVITKQIAENSGHFHIGFTLMGDVKQFAVSELHISDTGSKLTLLYIHLVSLTLIPSSY